MPGDLWLRTAKNLHKVADTNLLVAHQVQQAKPRLIAKGLKEPFHVVRLFRRHRPCIRIDVCERKPYSRQSKCLLGGGYVGATLGFGEVEVWRCR